MFVSGRKRHKDWIKYVASVFHTQSISLSRTIRMASKPKKSEKNTAEIRKRMDKLSLAHVNPYYDAQSTVTFARLEKGLLVFIYLYESSKNEMTGEIALWDHRACANMIVHGACTKAVGTCRCVHDIAYRQPNMCSYWYTNVGCQYGSRCRNMHGLQNVESSHRWIRNDSDYDVYRLIRFIRNFAGHYIDTVIDDQQALYKDIVVTMVYLVHYLSLKFETGIQHLDLFLEKTTINQLIPEDDLCTQLRQPWNVPEVFLESHFDFNSKWYRPDGQRKSIDFGQVSPDFIRYFNVIFSRYYDGRLKSRGAKKAWPQ